MRWENVHLRGMGAALGTLVPVDELCVNDDDRPRTGQRCVSVAANTTAVDLAVRAGRQALATTALTTPGPLPVPDLHFHAAMWRGSRGLDIWSRPAYVRSRLGLPAGPGICTELNAMSNSIVGGIDLTARILAGSPDLDTVLITGGERFGPPAFDHLTTDESIAYGDGGSALLIGHHAGLAQVLSTSSWADPALEGLHRGHTRLHPPGTTEVGTERLTERKTQYLSHVGVDFVHRRHTTGIREVMAHALEDARLERNDLAWVLLPHYGHHILETQCLQPLSLPVTRTLKHAGDQWGHIGPNDQIIGLTHLLARRAVTEGDYVALLGIGIGMTWTATILRISRVPHTLHAYAPPLRWPWRSPPRPHKNTTARSGETSCPDTAESGQHSPQA